ncbi:ATP-binding protein [Streptomyces longwoodensis]|uniref:ATP-binding protein n=1 Tax=Streptomyces longwoodensis TaxID=68231 RepID=UPI0033CDDECC
MAGERTGDVEPGPFDKTLSFSEGLTAPVASNFRGKTSLLELLTWCLRGTPRREMQSRVRSWVHHVDLDATVAGEPMAFRLDLTDGEITATVVLTGPDPAALAGARAPAPDRCITALLRAFSTDSYAEQIAGPMLGRMDLQPPPRRSDRAGRARAFPVRAAHVQQGVRPVADTMDTAGAAAWGEQRQQVRWDVVLPMVHWLGEARGAGAPAGGPVSSCEDRGGYHRRTGVRRRVRADQRYS